jgi:hypothetical protein
MAKFLRPVTSGERNTAVDSTESIAQNLQENSGQHLEILQNRRLQCAFRKNQTAISLMDGHQFR